MQELCQLVDKLNLIYFEYDQDENKFELDKSSTKEQTHNEFIKLTYTLTSENIEFMVDQSGDIVISCKDSFLSRLKCRVKNMLLNINNNNRNIYLLSDKKVKYAINLPVIEIRNIYQKIDFSKYDAIVFTSKNAVRAIDSMSCQWKELPSYVIAPQTAKEVKKLGGKLKFVGKKKHGNEFANELINDFQGEKLLYLGGTKIVSNLVNILNDNGVKCDRVSIYETVCKNYKTNMFFPKGSTFIFSSPSTIDCFLNNFKWDDSFKAVSIGKTTEKFFPDYIKPYVSATTSLESCVKKALQLN